MSPDNTAPIALTIGDPTGIGPEITDAAWQALRTDKGSCFFVISDPTLYENARVIDDPSQAAGLFQDHLPIYPISVPKCVRGTPKIETAQAVTISIERAVQCAQAGNASAIVTNPIAKSVLYEAGFKFPGHTEFLAHLCKDMPTPYARGPVMMLSGGGLNVALATIHIPLARVSSHLSIEGIQRTARTLYGALIHDLGIQNPRIAVAGLNPHAGEGGTIGHEDIDIINQASQALRKEGLNISDARSADTLFHEDARNGYDAVIAMYHDQGLIPVKTLDFHGGVNSTLGLPIIRTSPDHGTAFDIAGQGKANANSLINALHMARKMAKNRAQNANA